MRFLHLPLACLLTAAPLAAAQAAYPDKPIKIVVPFSAGGIVDSVARLVGEKLTKQHGQTVIVENRTGAGGAIGTDYAARAPADGYTLLLVSPSHAVTTSLQPRVTWDPVESFRAIAGFGIVPNVIVVHPNVPAQNMAQLIDLAKKKDPPLTYSTAGIGTSNHLSGELLAQEAQIPLTHIPYKGQSDALNDLLGGRVDLMPLTAALAMQHVKAGKLRALAVTTSERAKALPDLPTVAESANLPNYSVGTWFGLVAPKATPDEIVNQLYSDMQAILAMPDVQEKFNMLGMELNPQSPQEFDEFVAAEQSKWAQVIKQANIENN